MKSATFDSEKLNPPGNSRWRMKDSPTLVKVLGTEYSRARRIAWQLRGEAQVRHRRSGAMTGLTEHGERIPPLPDDPPCDDYDPTGIGAGLEDDGHPQCAWCGHQKTDHGTQPKAEA